MQSINRGSIIENRLVISYLSFYVIIEPAIDNNRIIYKLEAGTDVENKINFIFNNFEDALYFSEKYISKNYNMDLKELFYNYQRFKKEKILKRM